ncbi:MAG: Maf family protein [Armatimonadota bacterium]|jgi:septum formation protein|nr:Maf family protein [Armatimonadota bacterium]
MTRRVVLASASPRRRELLAMMGIPFEVVPGSVVEEEHAYTHPVELARGLAEEKARQVATRVEEGIVVGADTIVVVDGRVLGKPTNNEEAKAMLRLLSGRTHQVVTGVAVLDRQRARTVAAEVEHASTDVTFLPWSDEDINAYVATGEPRDKAGAYAIQGYAAVLIEGIRGCYFNVVGLPVSLLARMLRRRGVMVRPGPLLAPEAQ